MENYGIRVHGRAVAPFSGSKPLDVATLRDKPGKDTASLIFQIAKTQIELACQKGDTLAAMEALNAYRTQEFSYSAPTNVFHKDAQHGGRPFIGGYMIFGAIRDAVSLAFGDEIATWKGAGSKDPSKKHLKKYVYVLPHHVFMYRPTLGVGVVDKADEIEEQQPIGDVKGFARYEVIHPPFEFMFVVHVVGKAPFKGLEKKKVMKEVIEQAARNGLGGRRGVGYGFWEVLEMVEC
jgi:hypothetical protein